MYLARLTKFLYALAQRKVMAESREYPDPYSISAHVQRAALDNPDLPVNIIRDVLVAQAEASESFEFDTSNAQ